MALVSRFRIASLLAITALSTVACSLILDPDDSVQRCSNVTDCAEPADNRFEAVCIADEDANIDMDIVDQVCVAQFVSLPCDPANLEPLRVAVESRGFEDYACPDEMRGVRGCPPAPGAGCNDGLVQNDFGTCDDPNADVPSINHNNGQWENLEAQDVLDQYCRGFFCDDSYVCNNETNRCQVCDPDLPFGQGGCGDVYTQGSRSCVYVSADDGCEAPDSSTDEPVLGECVASDE